MNSWQEVLDKLDYWGDYHFVEDAAINKAIIAIAQLLVLTLRKTWKPPLTIVLDPNGGIVFTWEDYKEIHIWDDALIDYIEWKDGKIVTRNNFLRQLRSE